MSRGSFPERPGAAGAPGRGCGAPLRFRALAVETSVDELLRVLVDEIKYGAYLQADSPETARDRAENVSALIDGAAEAVVDDGGEVGLTPLDHFLQRAMLVSQVDALDPNADAVSLMTLHNAKGLEYPIVFLAGLEGRMLAPLPLAARPAA